MCPRSFARNSNRHYPSEIDLRPNESIIGDYFWTGPNGFSSNEEIITVTESGIYSLEITLDNGCASTKDLEVSEDANVPQLLVDIPFLNCNNEADSIQVVPDLPGGNYTWFIDGIEVGYGPNLTVLEAGEYEVIYELPNGCKSVEVVLVNEDFVEPIVSLVGGELNCANPSLNLNPQTLDNIDSWEWSGPNGFSAITQSVTIFDEGYYTLTSYFSNGCSTGNIVNIGSDFSDPDFSTNNDIITCDQREVQLMAEGNPTGFTFEWTGPNGYSSTEQNPNLNTGGTFYLLVEGTNGCTQNLVANIEVDTLLPAFGLNDLLLTCELTSSTLAPSIVINGEYSWLGPNGFSSTDQLINVSEIGEYTLELTGENGCVNIQSAFVDGDFELPTINAEDALIACDEVDVQLNAITSEGGIVEWSSSNGFISNDLNPVVTMPGIYELVFTAFDNGCENRLEIEVSQDDPVLAEARQVSPVCFGDVGMISFENIVGGVEPYLFSIDGGQTFSSQMEYTNLSEGNYSLIIQDAGECIWNDEVYIDQAPFLFSELESEIEVDYGDSFQLKPIINFPESNIQSIEWIPALGLSCSDCLEPFASPKDDIVYRVEITTIEGCETESDVFFRVKNDKDIYIPNAFSPNNDANNDGFTVFADLSKIVEVKRMIIVDRWGAIVYARDNFLPNDTNLGWDGSHKGELLNPGVFVYYINVEWLDGTIENFKGDVTLMR